jgi:predicted DNA-binding ribbon-helix-helix protein
MTTRNIVRTFYSEKNSFFKRLKKIYSENLEKQKNLINQVDNIHKEENLENFRSQVISIQKQLETNKTCSIQGK